MAQAAWADSASTLAVVQEDTENELEKLRQIVGDQTLPVQGKNAFSCPSCGAFAHQEWFDVNIHGGWGSMAITGATVAKCARCEKFSYWIFDRLIHPATQQGPAAHADMPEAPRPTTTRRG